MQRDTPPESAKSPADPWPPWFEKVTAFRQRRRRQAIWQMVNTFVPYGVLWYLMVRCLQLGYSYVLVLALAVLAAGFLTRIFIIFHDCVHGSFFVSERANTVLGYLCGILVFTPFDDWRFSHFRHHDTYANLDARGHGDVTLLTVAEYRQASRGTRLLYRLYRSPFVLLGLGPIFHFLLLQRFPSRHTGRGEWRSVLVTDLALLAIAVLVAFIAGWKTYLLIQMPVLWMAGAAGIWLFYVQHQFEGVYWARADRWDPVRAAFVGASFYDLPAILRWFSGNIGYHFIHHIQYGIPSYNLVACYEAVGELHGKARVTLRESLRCSRLKLWDEDAQRLVGWPRGHRDRPPAR